MGAAQSTVAILGPTGYTGRLVCDEARAAGLALRLVGRRASALAELARPGEETALADSRDEATLSRAFEGVAAVISCAGPFLELGDAPVRAAIAAGAHYLDSSGEQAFARLVYERHGPAAAAAGVVLLTSFGFDYVPGDLAARLAAAGLGEPLDEVVVAYSVSSMAASSGTRRTVGHVLAQPLAAWEEGRLVESRFGKTARTVRFPFGEREVVEWSGTEPLTVPRHTEVRAVRSYVRAPTRMPGPLRRLARFAAPFVRLTGRVGGDPSPDRRAGTRFAVVAEARVGGAGRRATLVGNDPYALTALLLVRGAEALLAGEARSFGALAPAEAFDAETFAARLAPFLRIDSVTAL
jgi:short subunit dehydrogenase-like uncharacterized protein